jgi:hypothetical protein
MARCEWTPEAVRMELERILAPVCGQYESRIVERSHQPGMRSLGRRSVPPHFEFAVYRLQSGSSMDRHREDHPIPGYQRTAGRISERIDRASS